MKRAYKRIRISGNWTQKEVAEATGIAQSTISMLERGDRADPVLSTLEKLAAFYGRTIDQLVERDKLVGNRDG